MATYTNTQILEATREAIYNLTVGGVQSYTILNRTVTKLDLKELRDQEAYYQKLVNQENGNGIFSVGVPR